MWKHGEGERGGVADVSCAEYDAEMCSLAQAMNGHGISIIPAYIKDASTSFLLKKLLEMRKLYENLTLFLQKVVSLRHK